MLEKIFLAIIKTGLYATLAMPFIVTKLTLFPFVFGKAVFFQIIIEIVLIFWVALLLLYPQYRPWFYKVEKTRSGNVAKKYYNWLNLAVLAWLAGLLLAAIFSVNPARSFWGTQERMTGAFTILHFGLYYFMLVSVMQSSGAWKRFLLAVVGSGVMVSGYSIYEAFRFASAGYRTSAWFGNPGFLGSFLFFCAFLPFMVIGFYRRHFRSKGKVFVIIGGLIIIEATFLYAIILNATRAVWVGLFVAIIINCIALPFFLKSKKDEGFTRIRIWHWYLSLIFVCAVFLFGAITAIGKLPETFYSHSSFLRRARSIITVAVANPIHNSRVMAWRQGFRALQERPLFGYGPENFNLAFNRYYDPSLIALAGSYGEQLDFDKAHNEFVEHIVTIGIIGSAAYFTVFAAALFVLWRKRKEHTTNLLLLTLLFGYMTMVQFTFDTPITYLLLMVVFGLIHFATLFPCIERDAQGARGRGIAGIALLPLMLGIVVSIALFNIKPLFASHKAAIGRIASEQGGEEAGTEVIFNYYYTALQYNTPYAHEITRYMAMDVLGKIDVYKPQDKDMITYAVKWISKYASGDWFLEILLGRGYSFLCEEDSANCNRALEHFAQAEKLAPMRHQVHSSRMSVYLKLRDYEKARQSFERAIALGFSPPNTAPVHSQLGFLHAQLKLYDKALEHYESARLLDENNIDILESIAFIAKASGDTQKARETAMLMVEIEPRLQEKVENFLKDL